MPTLKMYVGKIFIDECQLVYTGCHTIRDREKANLIAKREMAFINRDILDMGFIPTFFLDFQSAMNDPDFCWTEEKVDEEIQTARTEEAELLINHF